MAHPKFSAFLSAGILCCAATVSAQERAPSAQQIIDALKPAPAAPAATPAAPAKPAAKTRNLSVEDVPAPSPAPSAAPSPAPVSMASPAPATRPSIDLAIQFDVNSDHVQAASVKLLNNLAEALQAPELRQARFLVEGHTDGSGQAAYNKRLSAQRAMQVKRILVQNHVDPSRIVTDGKGSSELLNPAIPTAPENRRVRVVMLGL